MQDYAEMNIRASEGVAVREFPLRKGHGVVDYMLYADGKAIGSVEAKPEGHTLRGVATQSGKYAAGLKDSTAAYGPVIIFGYESTGAITQFTNTLEPDARSREIFQFPTLEKDPAYLVPRRDRRTRRKRYAALDEDLTYTANRLDLDVVNQAQIRLVVNTFKERLFTEIFPGRTEVPKTLVFAKNDSHADDITEIIREEFGKGNDFCQKITYRTTGKKPEDLLQEFRNDYHPRIAVSVDMIATGTDVKPLECLLFMRNVKSANYFEQMKGRGSRVIGVDDLQGVTPDADAKTRFVIVDAVGLTEHDKTETQSLDRKRSISVERLLQSVAERAANAKPKRKGRSRTSRPARTGGDQPELF